MLGCEQCERFFPDADTKVDCVIGNEGYEYSVCPYCGSDQVTTVYRCTLCGDYKLGADDECNTCRREFNSYLEAFLYETSEFFQCDEERIREALERRMEI